MNRAWCRLGEKARPAGTGPLWPLYLAVAVASLLVAVSSVVTAWSVYTERAMRDAARSPVFTDSAADATFLWMDSSDAVGERDAEIVTIEPLVDDAPLPPGLVAWPAPGEVVLSPAMTRLDPALAIGSRYGDVVSTIRADGLASPSELLAYVRPSDNVVREAMYPAVAYGGTAGRGNDLGELREIEPLTTFLLAMAILLVAPALLLVRAASGLGEIERSRQATVLLTLGASRRVRRVWAWGAVRRAWTVGALAGLALAAMPLVFDVRVPPTGFTVQARDARAHVGSLGLAIAFTLVGTAVLALRGARAHRRAQTRIVAEPARWSRSRAFICAASSPVAIIAALATTGVIGPALAGSPLALLAYFAAVMTTLATLPHLLGAVLVRLASGMRARARAEGDGPSLIAAAAMSYDSRTAVRSGWALAACLVLVTQVQGFLTVQGTTYRQAQASNAATQGAALEITARPELQAANVWPRVLAQLRVQVPDAAAFLVVPRTGPDGYPKPAVVVAEHAAWAAFDLPGEGTLDPRTVDSAATNVSILLTDIAGAPTVEVEATETPLEQTVGRYDLGWQNQATLLLLDPAGEPLPAATVHRIAARSVAPMMRVLEPGESWLIGASATRANVVWVALLAQVGAALLTAALLASGVDDLRSFARRLARLAVLAGRRGLVARVVLARTGIPLVVSAGTGAVLSLLLLSALFTSASTPLSITIVSATLAMAGVTLLVAVAVALGAIRSARHALR